jgi:hypothetical protein
MMRALVPLAVLVALLMQDHSRVRAQPETPTLAQFIEIVRGYDVTTVRRTFAAYNQGLFATLFGAGEPIPLSSDEQRALFTNQIVLTSAGHRIDIGHVITGLEAATAATPTSRTVEMVSGCIMVGSVTWSGDVGQALHDYIRAGGTDPTPFFDAEASVEDLLGDVDGWTLAMRSGGATLDVADYLEQAYLHAQPSLDANRFRAFAISLDENTDGSVLSELARAIIAREITCFARAIAALTSSGITAAAIEQAAPYFVDRFIRFVEEGLAEEMRGTQ